MLQNEGADEVNNYGRTERKERQVNKIHANAGGLNAELFAKPRAHSKQLEFEQ